LSFNQLNRSAEQLAAHAFGGIVPSNILLHPKPLPISSARQTADRMSHRFSAVNRFYVSFKAPGSIDSVAFP
jgi:hypothetical protein